MDYGFSNDEFVVIPIEEWYLRLKTWVRLAQARVWQSVPVTVPATNTTCPDSDSFFANANMLNDNLSVSLRFPFN